jgi:hypothetical protein
MIAFGCRNGGRLQRRHRVTITAAVGGRR